MGLPVPCTAYQTPGGSPLGLKFCLHVVLSGRECLVELEPMIEIELSIRNAPLQASFRLVKVRHDNVELLVFIKPISVPLIHEKNVVPLAFFGEKLDAR